jgi:hypothetical protein
MGSARASSNLVGVASFFFVDNGMADSNTTDMSAVIAQLGER